jgi:hypothetical protein
MHQTPFACVSYWLPPKQRGQPSSPESLTSIPACWLLDLIVHAPHNLLPKPLPTCSSHLRVYKYVDDGSFLT